MSPKRDDKTGKFDREYPQKEFLDAITEIETATTSRVAEYVGCSYDLAYRRLNELLDDGKVEKKEIGGSFIWK